MNDPDARLAAFFAASEPPVRDPAFSAEVLEALARARFRREMASLSLFSLLSAIVLWAVGPSLGPVIEALGHGVAPAGAALAGGAVIAALVMGRGLSAPSLRS